MQTAQRIFFDSAEEQNKHCSHFFLLQYTGVFHLHGNTTSANTRVNLKQKLWQVLFCLHHLALEVYWSWRKALRSTGKKCTRMERMASYRRKLSQSSQEDYQKGKKKREKKPHTHTKRTCCTSANLESKNHRII